MKRFTGILKVLGPRLIAVIASLLSAKLAERQVTVEPETLTAIMIGVYAGVHKAVSSQVNPGDAATGRVSDAIKDAADPEVGNNTVVVASKQP